MDERLRLVARLLDGEKMAALCREFDISRKTGYKLFNRYKDCGLEGLEPPTTWFEVTRTNSTFQLEQSLATLAASANPT